MTASTPPPLPADLNEGLKRLKMAAMRRLAPELLVSAKTQRWRPEEFLRTLVETEIAARDASKVRTRMRQAAFPVTKTLEDFDAGTSTWPPAGTATWPLTHGRGSSAESKHGPRRDEEASMEAGDVRCRAAT